MKRIETIRKKSGIQKQEITAFVGLDRAAYSGWVKGKPRLSVDQLVGICECLGIDAAETFAASKKEKLAEETPRLIPLEKRPRRVNRRDDLPMFPIVNSGAKGAIKIPRFESVAAGFGEDLERSEEFTYVRELPDWRGVHSIIVRGDSMEDTLHPGDLILVQSFGKDGITLQPRGNDPKNSKKQLQRFIPDDELFIFSLNDQPPTVKRIQYQGDLDWKLQIRPDNPDYRVHTMTAEDKIVFYARVMGIGDKRYVDRK